MLREPHDRRTHSPPQSAQISAAITRRSLDVDAQLAVLVGPNGAGKTNLIEAISFLPRAVACAAPRSTRSHSPRATAPGRSSAEIEGALGLATLGTGIEPPPAEADSQPRKCRIDGEPVGSAAAFTDHVRVVWLTPAMDPLFAGPASERRRFLDRLVLAVDADAFEPRQRAGALAALAQPAARRAAPDPHWLDAIEHETAELAVAVAAAARRNGAAPCRRARAQPRAGDAVPVGRDRARRLDRERAAGASRRPRWRTATAPSCATTARAMPPPAARPMARISPTSPCVYGPKGIAAARRLDRRAEGAADRARAGACGAASPR